MKTRSSIALATFALMTGSAALAQPYKCVDKEGKVTYASEPCKALKLKDAGAVEDRLTVTPAPKEKPAQKSAKPKTAATTEPKAAPARQKENAMPERRCFQVKNKLGGTSTRCNDDPGVPNPVPTDERTKGEVKAK